MGCVQLSRAPPQHQKWYCGSCGPNAEQTINKAMSYVTLMASQRPVDDATIDVLNSFTKINFITSTRYRVDPTALEEYKDAIPAMMAGERTPVAAPCYPVVHQLGTHSPPADKKQVALQKQTTHMFLSAVVTREQGQQVTLHTLEKILTHILDEKLGSVCIPANWVYRTMLAVVDGPCTLPGCSLHGLKLSKTPRFSPTKAKRSKTKLDGDVVNDFSLSGCRLATVEEMRANIRSLPQADETDGEFDDEADGEEEDDDTNDWPVLHQALGTCPDEQQDWHDDESCCLLHVVSCSFFVCRLLSELKRVTP